MSCVIHHFVSLYSGLNIKGTLLFLYDPTQTGLMADYRQVKHLADEQFFLVSIVHRLNLV